MLSWTVIVNTSGAAPFNNINKSLKHEMHILFFYLLYLESDFLSAALTYGS